MDKRPYVATVIDKPSSRAIGDKGTIRRRRGRGGRRPAEANRAVTGLRARAPPPRRASTPAPWREVRLSLNCIKYSHNFPRSQKSGKPSYFAYTVKDFRQMVHLEKWLADRQIATRALWQCVSLEFLRCQKNEISKVNGHK